MVFRMCVNQPPTGGRKGPLNSQTQKLAVGAPTGISWAPRVHGGLDPVPTGSRAHGTSPVHMGPRAHGGQKPRVHGVPRTACSSPLKP